MQTALFGYRQTQSLTMPVLSGVTDRMLLKIAGRPTGHLCLQLGVTSLCKDSSGEDRTSGALRSTQNGVLGGGGGASLETSRASYHGWLQLCEPTLVSFSLTEKNRRNG